MPRLKPGAPRPLTVAINSSPNALLAPLFVARADGEVAAGALAVSIVEPPGADSLAALDAGEADIAIASEPALLAARHAGRRLVAIGVLVRRPLEALVSLAGHPISSVAQLAHRTVATTGTPFARALLTSALRSAHLSPGQVRQISTGDLNAALTSQRAVASLSDAWPLDSAALAAAAHPAHVLALGAGTVPAYNGLVIVVRVGEARTRGPLLRAFLQSLTRGAHAVFADPAAAAATLAKAHRGTSEARERAALTLTIPLSEPSGSDTFGYQDPVVWRAFARWLHAHGLPADPADAGFALTDEFLPGQGG